MRLFLSSVLTLALLFSASLAHAADSTAKAKVPPPAVIVIDVQRILQESLAAKSVQKQLETQRAKFQSQIEDEENGLRKAEQDLSKSRSQLAADVFADREQQLRQRFLTVERHVQARRKVLDQAFTDSMSTVRTRLLDIVSKVAHEKGANLALVKQQIIWVDKPLDVTDEVLQRLNTAMPDLAIKMPAEDKP